MPAIAKNPTSLHFERILKVDLTTDLRKSLSSMTFASMAVDELVEVMRTIAGMSVTFATKSQIEVVAFVLYSEWHNDNSLSVYMQAVDEPRVEEIIRQNKYLNGVFNLVQMIEGSRASPIDLEMTAFTFSPYPHFVGARPVYWYTPTIA